MKKFVIVAGIVVVSLAAVAFYTGMFKGEPAAAAAGQPGGGGFPGGGGRGGFPGGGFPGGGRGGRDPMTVEMGAVTRASIAEEITVVGNLIGEATVAVAPRAAGRLQEVYVKLGDRVTRGQRIATIEDFELQEQVKQAEAAQEVSQATIRQRDIFHIMRRHLKPSCSSSALTVSDPEKPLAVQRWTCPTGSRDKRVSLPPYLPSNSSRGQLGQPE